ncbi:hypothetical protein QEZ54_12995 [Catellatospora sp. KI3]|uniref:hypothetical protein n=1 Tax=Catellatospora sp. KI3 TaxID=3041620 RepID=UPI0024830F76|nr:hypothetical protein [Catellatospora sp. KI3]MDI1461889.1 hypothetical protein [Catellatospora sp. KI3]
MRERGTLQAVRCAAALLAGAALLLGSGAPAWADGPADLALRSYAVHGVDVGEGARVPLAVHNYGPAEPLPTAMVEVSAPPGTRIHRSSTPPDVPPCQFLEGDTRMRCRLGTLWRGQAIPVGGSSGLITIVFDVRADFVSPAEGWAEVQCSCDPYPANNRVAIVLNGENPPLPKPGPRSSASSKPAASVKPSASLRASRAASPLASTATTSPTGDSEAAPTGPMPELTPDPTAEVDSATAPPGSSGPDLVLLAGIAIVLLALAGLGGAVYVWRRDRTE